MLLTRKVILLFALCVAGALASDNSIAAITNRAGNAFPPEVLTNEGLIALANAGFSDAFIVQKILLSDRTRFDVSVEGLTNLRRNALSENLVLFLVEHSAQPSVARATPVMPAAIPIAVKTKVRMKKIAVPVVAADALNSPFAHLATVANPVVGGGPIYSTYAPNSSGLYRYYDAFGYVPYAYPVPSAEGVMTAPQVTPVAAASWWK